MPYILAGSGHSKLGVEWMKRCMNEVNLVCQSSAGRRFRDFLFGHVWRKNMITHLFLLTMSFTVLCHCIYILIAFTAQRGREWVVELIVIPVCFSFKKSIFCCSFLKIINCLNLMRNFWNPQYVSLKDRHRRPRLSPVNPPGAHSLEGGDHWWDNFESIARFQGTTGTHREIPHLDKSGFQDDIWKEN